MSLRAAADRSASLAGVVPRRSLRQRDSTGSAEGARASTFVPLPLAARHSHVTTRGAHSDSAVFTGSCMQRKRAIGSGSARQASK